MKRAKTLIILLVLLALLGGAYFLLDSGILEKKTPSVEEPDDRDVVYQLFSSSLPPIEIEIAGGTETYTFRYTGGWTYQENTNYPIDAAQIDAMAACLADLKANRLLDRTDENIKKFGLDKPGMTITFKMRGGETHTISLGKQNTATTDHYALFSDSNSIVTLSDETIAQFRKKIIDYIIIPEMDTFDAQTVTSATVNGKENADLATFLTDFNSMYVTSCEVPYAEDLAAYGMDTPYADIQIKGKNEYGVDTEYWVKIGSKLPDNGDYRYAVLSTQPNTVYRMFYMNYEFLDGLLAG